ncbi:hypothetical protein ARMGADRAFT_548755 [Armillaria gallica]|uniref:C2H2-type domain-containing protein n=1 Tax=Armillaria gallica TaxID=47427 RepID=A0A2H3CUY4_ARMGA|nr:hypothetical protein ARMGADRAFT_548755 [Armillaria gallica]
MPCISRRLSPSPSVSRAQSILLSTSRQRTWPSTGRDECYLCHVEFSTLQSLNLHLNSPVHDANEFKCPKRRCGKKFKVVSALIQHIENESCGLARFTTVQMEAMLLTRQFARLVLG